MHSYSSMHLFNAHDRTVIYQPFGKVKRMTEEHRPENEQNAGQFDSQINSARDTAEKKIDHIIDSFAKKVPGGEQFQGQAKDMASGALNMIQNEARKRSGDILGQAGNILGRLFGGSRRER